MSAPRRFRGVSRSSPSLLPTLFAAQMLMASSYGVMFTVLRDFRDQYHIHESGLGLIVATGFFLSFFSQVTLAPLADRGHARAMLMVGVALTGIGTAGMAVGHTLTFLMASRAVAGLGSGMALPALRRIVILSNPDAVGANLGRLLSVDVCGFMIGPVISALTVDTLGLPAPFWIIACALVAVVPLLSRVRVDDRDRTGAPTERFAFDLLRDRRVGGAIVIGLAVFLMIGGFDALWSVMMHDIGAPRWMVSVGITVFALPLILLGPVGGRLAEQHGPFRLSSLGLIIGAVCMLAYGSLPVAAMMLAVGFVHAFNDGLTITGTGVAIALVAPPQRQAAAQGLLGGLQTLMGGMAALSAGWSYEHFGRFPTYAMVALLMIAFVAAGAALTGPAWHQRGHAPARTLDPVGELANA